MIGNREGLLQGERPRRRDRPVQGRPGLLKGVLSGAADIGLTGATDRWCSASAAPGSGRSPTNPREEHTSADRGALIQEGRGSQGRLHRVTVVGSTTWVFARHARQEDGLGSGEGHQDRGVGGLDAQAAALRRGETQACIFGDAGSVLEAQGVGRILMRLDEVTPKLDQPGGLRHRRSHQDQAGHAAAHAAGHLPGHKFFRDNPTTVHSDRIQGIGWPEPAARLPTTWSRPLLSVDGRMDLDAMKVMQDTLRTWACSSSGCRSTSTTRRVRAGEDLIPPGGYVGMSRHPASHQVVLIPGDGSGRK